MLLDFLEAPLGIFNDTPYCKGAFALYNLRVRMVANLGNSQPAATQAFFQLMRALYKAHSTQRLSTQKFVTFVEKNLVGIMQANGISITQAQATTQVSRWKAMWFVGLRENSSFAPTSFLH